MHIKTAQVNFLSSEENFQQNFAHAKVLFSTKLCVFSEIYELFSSFLASHKIYSSHFLIFSAVFRPAIKMYGGFTA